MKYSIVWMIVLMVPAPFLWAMTVDKEKKQVTFSLTQAMGEGASEEVVQFFLRKGSDINEVNDNGMTPLCIAVAQGNEGLAAFLVSQGADVNGQYLSENIDSAPLISAVRAGNLSFVMFLVAHDADINVVGRGGNPALMMASASGRINIVAFLLMQADLDICYRFKKGTGTFFASPKANRTIFDVLSQSPDLHSEGHLLTALMIGNKIDHIKKKILSLCSLCPLEGLSQQEQEKWLEKLKAKIKRRILQIHTIDIADENGNTPLHKAIIAGNYALAFWILSIQPSLVLRENRPTLKENESEEEVPGEAPLYYDASRRRIFAEFTRKCIEGCKEEIEKSLREKHLKELEQKKKAIT